MPPKPKDHCSRGHDLTLPGAVGMVRHATRGTPERRCLACRREANRKARAERQRWAERYPRGEQWKVALKTVEKIYGPHRTWRGFQHPGHLAWTAEMARLAGITLPEQRQLEESA